MKSFFVIGILLLFIIQAIKSEPLPDGENVCNKTITVKREKKYVTPILSRV